MEDLLVLHQLILLCIGIPRHNSSKKNLIQQFLHIRIIGYLNVKLAQHLED
jgi:hypothetical protein|uniref:Uncharacterized protein n=1 Tax=virus sp. ctQcs9 TaxID=2825816 RepID=A0A8S5RAW4_9VIRU|nr:MAG TPA: hypothetical protein [virus sp. ctQcs9]